MWPPLALPEPRVDSPPREFVDWTDDFEWGSKEGRAGSWHKCPFFLTGRTESLVPTEVGVQWTFTFEAPEGLKPEL